MQLFKWRDVSTWPKFLGEQFVIDEPIDECLVDEFYRSYSHICVFHSARPLDPKKYLEEGIKKANYDELIESYRKNMNDFCQISFTDEQIAYARGEIGSFHNRRLFVVLDDEELLRRAGHYAIYGSEYLVGITNRLSEKYGNVDLSHLTKFGISTVYELHIPIDEFPENDIPYLVREINNYICDGAEGEGVDFTFEFYMNIPGEHIVNFYHPGNIEDPLDR